MRPLRNHHALTLIEVILALGLGLMIMSLVYGFWHTMAFSGKAFKEHATFYRNLNLSLQSMQDDFMKAVPYDFKNSYPDRVDFSGKAKRIEFLAALDDGINVVVYELGRPDWGTRKTVIVNRDVEDIKSILVNSSTTDNRVFLLRGQKLLKDVLKDNEAPKASQVLFGPIAPDILTWKFVTIEDGKTQETTEWGNAQKPELAWPKAIKVSVVLPDAKSQTKTMDAVMLLPEVKSE